MLVSTSKEENKMAQNRKRTMEMQAGGKIYPSNRANGHNGHYPSSGPFSWYSAQCAEPGLTYALTTNGYVVLSSRN